MISAVRIRLISSQNACGTDHVSDSSRNLMLSAFVMWLFVCSDRSASTSATDTSEASGVPPALTSHVFWSMRVPSEQAAHHW